MKQKRGLSTRMAQHTHKEKLLSDVKSAALTGDGEFVGGDIITQ